MLIRLNRIKPDTELCFLNLDVNKVLLVFSLYAYKLIIVKKIDVDIQVIDADLLTRRVHRDPAVCRKILECFGGQAIVDTPEGPVVQRGELAKLAFSSEESRQMLNQIMQPALYTEAQNAIERASNPCILDAPLLFEARWDVLTDWNVVVLCPLDVRIQRIQARDQLPERQILARIQAQMTDEQRSRRADSIIYNTSTLESLRRQTEHIFSNI